MMIFPKLFNIASLNNDFKRGFVWVLLSSIVAGGASILVPTLIGYFESVDKIGIYTQVYGLFLLFTSISNWAIEISTLKYSAQFYMDENKLKLIYSSSTQLIIFISLLFLSALFTIYYLFSENFNFNFEIDLILIMAPSVFLFALNKNSSSFLSGIRKMKLYSSIRLMRWLLTMSFILFFLALDFNFNYIFYSFLITELIIFLWMFIYNKEFITNKIDTKWIKIHFRFGSLNVISIVFSVLSSYLVVFISGLHLSRSDTGIIAFIVSFCSLFLIFSNSIQINFNPYFSKLWSDERYEEINSLVIKIFKKARLFFFPLLFGANLIYFFYITLFMSDDFNKSFFIFFLFSFSAAIQFLFMWPGVMLNMSGKVKVNMYRGVLISVFSTLSYILFIQYLGVLGAALSSILNSTLNIIVTYGMIKKHLRINLMNLFIQ